MTQSKYGIKRIFLYSVLLFSSYICADQVTETAVKETAKSTLEKIGEVTLEAASYVGLAYQIHEIVDQVRTHTFPTKEEEEHAELIAEQYGFLASESGLEKCLIKNRSASERIDSGLPKACKEIAETLVFFGGKAEADRMTAIYNEYRK